MKKSKKVQKRKKKYKQLTHYRRDRIEAMLNTGHKQTEIAKVLKVDKSTISREIKRNRRKIRTKKGTKEGNYEADIAGHKAYVRRKYSKYQGKQINENRELQRYIIERLEIEWSPDEISGRMKKDKEPFYASKTAIYEWLYSAWGQPWCQYLLKKRRNRKKRKGKKTKRTLIPNRKGIEERPMGASNKSRYGHYESDTMVSGKKTGSKTALSVVYEKKARYIDGIKIPDLKPASHNNALRTLGEDKNIKSFTMDNGIENTLHEDLGIPTFFCDPYSSWQKGGVEHGIGMIRRYIPKGSDIAEYPDWYISMVIDILNNKPRKSLGYKTPREVMIENNQLVDNKKTEVALRG
ncbi:IS30 family transposase [Candidatus Poribacteria bacterium]|nr:IS30 family transposase [Candidatus Poribacteria bacterium]